MNNLGEMWSACDFLSPDPCSFPLPDCVWVFPGLTVVCFLPQLSIAGIHSILSSCDALGTHTCTIILVVTGYVDSPLRVDSDGD